MTSYPTLSLSAARRLVKALENQEAVVNLSEFIVIKGSGDSNEVLLKSLKKVIEKESTNLRAGALDAKLSPVVHRYLSASEPQILQDRDFWRYLSCYEFHDLVATRFPKETKKEKNAKDKEVPSNWENYGAKVEDIKNSYLYRLFLAADLTYDSGAKNPYHLVETVTDVDIYRSHIIRVKSGDNPEYSKALLSWFANRESWYKKNDKSLNISNLFRKYNKNPHREHLRDIAKRTLRLRSNIVHEFLSKQDLEKLIDVEATKSIRNIEKWGKVKEKSGRKASRKSGTKKKRKKA